MGNTPATLASGTATVSPPFSSAAPNNELACSFFPRLKKFYFGQEIVHPSTFQNTHTHRRPFPCAVFLRSRRYEFNVSVETQSPNTGLACMSPPSHPCRSGASPHPDHSLLGVDGRRACNPVAWCPSSPQHRPTSRSTKDTVWSPECPLPSRSVPHPPYHRTLRRASDGRATPRRCTTGAAAFLR